MDRYKVIKIRRYNWWIGLFQGSINIRNCFQLNWKWIHTEWTPETEFSFCILGFVLPYINEHRSLIRFSFKKWNMQDRACNIHFSLLYFPDLMLILGNRKTWLHLRCLNWEMWRNERKYRNEPFE